MVDTFNQEKALVGAFSVIIQLQTSLRFKLYPVFSVARAGGGGASAALAAPGAAAAPGRAGRAAPRPPGRRVRARAGVAARGGRRRGRRDRRGPRPCRGAARMEVLVPAEVEVIVSYRRHLRIVEAKNLRHKS